MASLAEDVTACTCSMCPDILTDLTGHMEHVQDVTSSASEAIRQRYFPASVAPVWIGEVS